MSYNDGKDKDCSTVGWGPVGGGFMVMSNQSRNLGEAEAEIKE